MDVAFDIVIRHVPYYGYFFMLIADGVERMRGEFQADALTAMLRGQASAEKIFGEVKS